MELLLRVCGPAAVVVLRHCPTTTKLKIAAAKVHASSKSLTRTGSISRPPPTLTREDRLPERKALAQAVGLAQLQLQRDWMNARSSLLALDAVETGLLEGPQAGMDKVGWDRDGRVCQLHTCRDKQSVA